jgi:IS66 Orf2 like protein
MLDLFIPACTTRVVVYLHPINLRWGPPKLRAFCTETVGIEPDYHTAFIFTNKACDTLLMYSLDGYDGQTLTKKLTKGAFLLPAASDESAPYVIMKPSMIGKLFRS